MRQAALFAVSTLVLLTGSALAQPLPEAWPEQVGLSSERVGQVLRQEIEKGKFPGALVAILMTQAPGPSRLYYRQLFKELVEQPLID